MSQRTDIVAYVSPPREVAFAKFTDYLQAFTHFLDFLERHPNVGNEQTKKRVTLPSKSSLDKVSADVLSRIKGAPESEDSDWEIPRRGTSSHSPPPCQAIEPEAPVLTPATTVVSVPLDQRLQALRSSPPPPPRPAGLPVGSVPAGLPVSVVDSKGAVLLGKKKVKKALLEFCTEELAAHLVSLDKVSREPGEFERELDFFRRKSARHGGCMLGLDTTREGVFTVMGNGRPTSADFMAMWESSEASEG